MIGRWLASTWLCLLAVPAGAGGMPEPHGSGFFLNMEGDLLTARHVVEGCNTLYVLKDGKVSSASVHALSDVVDAAVLRTDLRPVLTAAFGNQRENAGISMPVFAEGYSDLQKMPQRHRTLFNAVTVPGKSRFSMMSSMRPGASGSAVLAADGRVLAMVVERAAISSRERQVRFLSGRGPDPSPGSSGTEVAAVAATDLLDFLDAHGVRSILSDYPQLGRGQPVAPRAATISAGVICGR